VGGWGGIQFVSLEIFLWFVLKFPVNLVYKLNMLVGVSVVVISVLVSRGKKVNSLLFWRLEV
jgi:hypothetical protein